MEVSRNIHPSVDLSLIIPTYNEHQNIALFLQQVYAVLQGIGCSFEILVVDDDSPDGTWACVQALIKEYPGLRLIRRLQERGLATAVLCGWQEAQGALLAVMDADLQHPPAVLAQLVRALDTHKNDIAVASRHVAGGGVSQWHVLRRAISWGATLAATWVLPGTLATIRDPMSGYFVLRRSVIEDCHLNPEGYKILLEVLVRGHYRSVIEVPYTFVERERGQSKLGARQYREFVIHLIRLAWETGELRRLARYCLVGASGVLVNMGTMATLTTAGVGYLFAGALAVETAIVTNFLLNECWSFADFIQQRKSVRARLKRFAMFNLFCTGGAGVALALLWLLTSYGGFHPLFSNFCGILAATIWNYGMNANVTWVPTRTAHAEHTSCTNM